MKYVVLYLGMMLIGYAIGGKRRGKASNDTLVNLLLLISVSILVFMMGARMGANQEVVDNIGSIGWISLLITVALWIGAVVAITCARKIMGIDKWGYIGGNDTPEEDCAVDELEAKVVSTEENAGDNDIMTKAILVCIAAGILVGFFYIRKELTQEQIDSFYNVTGYLLTIFLCMMVFVIGYGMGLSGTIVEELKGIGARVFAIPAAVIVGTTIVAIIVGFVLPQINVRESLAISYGFGWYTYAPVAIANAGHEIAGAISFLHNVIRELGGLVLIPLLAKRVGYIEVTSLPGIAAMDICLPIIQRATREEIIAYAFAVGLIEEVATTVLVPIIIGA